MISSCYVAPYAQSSNHHLLLDCGIGALLGMISSCYVALYGQARILCVVARDHMLPPALARIAPSTGTPVAAATLMGLITGAHSKL